MSNATAVSGLRSFSFWAFVVLMLGLTGLFVVLGVWQVNRLAEKEALIAAVETRMHQQPLALPPAAEWVGLDAETYAFRPVTVTGRFRNAESVLVFTSIETANGKFSGPGYWVMTPLEVTGGGTIFINRGFVPQAASAPFAEGQIGPEGETTITGLALKPESAGAFTPGADPANRVEWVRDPVRLAAMVDPALAPFAPFTIDAPSGEPGALPQGGETVVEFPNNHLGYAMTWFGFAILTPLLLAYWVWRQVKK